MHIRFTGGRAMGDPAQCSAFNASRYRWVKKRIERTETVAPAWPRCDGADRGANLAVNAATCPGALPTHGRFDYSPITHRRLYRWPGGAGLAVYLGFNLEHFAFGEGLGAGIAPASPQPDVLNYSWREYGNRVGAWRCLELFARLGLPAAAIINTALYEHCPELMAACVARGDELVGHGHSNAQRQGGLPEAAERELLTQCRARMQECSGAAPAKCG